MSILCKTPSIRDVIAFPKTGAGADLLFESPAPARPDVLDQYGIGGSGLVAADALKDANDREGGAKPKTNPSNNRDGEKRTGTKVETREGSTSGTHLHDN